MENKEKNQVECPCCGWQGFSFIARRFKKNEVCPKCGSRKRHRLYYLYLKEILNKTDITGPVLKVLHFAPERCLSRLFRAYLNVEYLTADLYVSENKAPGMVDPMVKEDMTKLSFENETFDIVFSSHVLEHIEDDRKAMSEVYRVLKPGGFAVLQVPIQDRDKTFEDSSIKLPEDRLRVFGQSDHVRIYGRDYADRLRKTGFKVKVDRFADSIPEELIVKYGLSRESIYFCKKQ
jgi:SAM-dependent methyltransferase